MPTFDERERSFETKYKRDQETRFRVVARRNRLLGLWAARQFNMADDRAKDYAKEVVASDFEEPGDGDVVRKLLADFESHGVAMDEARLRKEMNGLMAEAAREVEAEED